MKLHFVVALVMLQLAAAARSAQAAAVDPELAVASPLALLQSTCSNPTGKIPPILNGTDCKKCMARVAETTTTSSLLGCRSICQNRKYFQHIKSTNYAPAKACSTCMAAPGVPASQCEKCLTSFSRDATAMQTCMTCLQGNRHNYPQKSYMDGCTLCAGLKNSSDASNCNGCISMGLVDPTQCASHALVRSPKLTLNFTSPTTVSVSGILLAVDTLVNGSGTLVASTNSSHGVTLQYQYATQLLLDASAYSMKNNIQGELDPFFSAVASACPNCTIYISGFYHTPNVTLKGVAISCGPLNTSGDWDHVIVPRLCNHSSNSSSGRHLLQGGLYTSIDTTWQYPSFVSTAGESSSCPGPFTGCNAANGEDQNLIQQICMWGGWYVNALSITWENGANKQWGNQASAPGPTSCLNVAIAEGEVITGVYTQVGDWMNGLAFVTNFGQVAQMGCGDTANTGGNGCPGNSVYTQWKYTAVGATPTAISQAQVSISNGWTTSNALSAALSQTTSSGYLCGVSVCSGEYINQITMYFMLPIASMTSSSTMNIVVGAPSSTATSTTSYTYASNLCSQPGDNLGSVSISTSTQVSSSLDVGTSYSTQYSKTLTDGWGLSIGYSVGPVGPSISGTYSGSVATTSSSTSTASTDTTTSTSSGSTGTVTENQICPSGIAPNTYCNWTFYGFSTLAWVPTSWDMPATYNLLGGASFDTTLGGSTTSGTESVTNVQLTSLICAGVQYIAQSPPSLGH